MSEIVIDTKTLPEPVMRLFNTKQVKVKESFGTVLLTPVNETGLDCPLFGMFPDGRISVEKFMAQKQEEKELEK